MKAVKKPYLLTQAKSNMQLKDYQQKALDQLELYLGSLKTAIQEVGVAKTFYEKLNKPLPADMGDYPRDAWKALKDQNSLPGIAQNGNTKIPDYISRTGASGEPIPHVCLKIPTGGGKTVLGVAALGRLQQDTGFVLWVVPTKAIYEQTIKSFKNREHPYRQMLERISGGRVKLFQKDDRFTQHDVDNHLCIMMLMFPAVNRKKNPGFLKIFRDSGGYASFFPEQDDATANQNLVNQHPDLEKNDSDEWVKQSLINTLKLTRPTVILDEAHKAYGTHPKKGRDNGSEKKERARYSEFVKSINQINPRFVLELSATPKIGISNMLVDISGIDLQAEEMIKLPIDIHSFSNSDWKHTLAESQNKQIQLEKAANKLHRKENRYIRPIALVRVQNTGKAQIGKGTIHAEDVREHLIRNLAVPENQIRVQTTGTKELTGEDLLSELSPVRWIITKDALKEGWDCPFAYVLVLLDNTTAKTAITQMVGRVMRQPQACLVTDTPALNRCYVYCYNRDVGKVVELVREGLVAEGLDKLNEFVHTGSENDSVKRVTVKRRTKFKNRNIFLPQVLHKEGYAWRLIDYDRDILSVIDWGAISAGSAVDLNDLNLIQEVNVTVDIQTQSKTRLETLDTNEPLALSYFVRRLLDVVPNPWQAARIVKQFIGQHHDAGHDDKKLLNNRVYLSEVLRQKIKSQLESKAEKIFFRKVEQKQIRFHLETDEQLNHELEKSFEVFVSTTDKSLQYNAQPVQRSLFNPIYEKDFNSLEEKFALYLDSSKAIDWWHRIAARQAYYLQGWRRDRVYPDFIARKSGDGKLLILETKGAHLSGNPDTAYKEKLLGALERTYREGRDCGDMEVKEPAGIFKMMFEDMWEEDLNKVLSGKKTAPRTP